MLDQLFLLLRKSLVLSIALVFTFVIVYVPQPPKVAEAQGVGATVIAADKSITGVGTFLKGIATSISTAATAVSSAASAVGIQALVVKDYGLDGIATGIARAIVSSMVASLVDWINSGFQGSPAFITDLQGFLLETLDKKAFEIIEELGGDASFLCTPFRLNIQIALAIQYDNTRVNRPYRGCSVSNFIGGFEEFLSGVQNDNFLRNWVTLTSNPQKYTPYGQYIEGRTAVRRELDEAKQQANTENNWGSGYQSGKICEQVESAGSRSSADNVQITTTPNPLATNQLPQNDVVIQTTPNPLGNTAPAQNDVVIQTTPNPLGNTSPTSGGSGLAAIDSVNPNVTQPQIGQVNAAPTQNNIGRAVSDVSRTLSGVSRSLSGVNLRCSISKPGRLIADRISKSLGLSEDTLITSDEINEIVSALIAQLATKAITGANGLLGLSRGTGYTYSNFADGYTARAAAEAAGAAQTAASSNISTAGDLVVKMQNALQVQEDIETLANRQVPILQDYLLLPLITADQIARARFALDDARDVQLNAPEKIDKLIPLINSTQALQLEYDRAETTLERKSAIIQELIRIETQFTSLGTYTETELRDAQRNWDTSRF